MEETMSDSTCVHMKHMKETMSGSTCVHMEEPMSGSTCVHMKIFLSEVSQPASSGQDCPKNRPRRLGSVRWAETELELSQIDGQNGHRSLFDPRAARYNPDGIRLD
jgi:hypothetical protein